MKVDAVDGSGNVTMRTSLALFMSAAMVACVAAGPASRASEPAVVGEAYVAELDADWNVTRESRVPCSPDQGCAIDLALSDPAFAAVHVRFAPPASGSVEVTSRLEGADGRASAPRSGALPLDHAGFGADHYGTRSSLDQPGGRIILMAVRVPGWTPHDTLGSASTPRRI